MNRVTRWLAVTAILSVAFHLGAVWAIPRVVMQGVLWRFAARFGTNQLVHAPMSDATSREVVRPSPDLAYSFCVLDLSGGPIRITMPGSTSYLSIALYSSVTDNYFVENDRDTGGGPIDLVVLPPRAHEPAARDPGITFITAPTAQGIALLRALVESRSGFDRIDSLRRKGVCRPYLPGTS